MLYHTLHLYADGASSHNPGPSASAWIIVDPKTDKAVVEDGEYLGHTTNNVAEYSAIIMGMNICIAHCREKVVVFSDSELCIRQINGQYKVKEPHLRPLFDDVMRLKAYFKAIKFISVPRTNEWVSRCDQIASETIDKHLGGPGISNGDSYNNRPSKRLEDL